MRTLRIWSVVLTPVVLVPVVLLGGSAPRPVVPPAVEVADPSATVTVHGRPGTFGATGETVPSGHTLARRGVPGWGLPAGLRLGRTVVAGDGMVLAATVGHNLDPAEPTARELVLAAYDPDANTHHVIGIQTSGGKSRAGLAPSIADLEPLPDDRGSDAVAFTAWPAPPSAGARGTEAADGQGSADGQWPVFGVASSTNGAWQLARGPGWVNQWTAAELGLPSGDPDQPTCQATGPDNRACLGLTEMATLPRSRDLIAAQPDGSLVALRLAGPDRSGRYDARVTGSFRYPQIADPGRRRPGAHLDLTPMVVVADPAGTRGVERFAVSFRITNPGGQVWAPSVLQEFSYDADTGEIRPVSAPIIPGDRTSDGGFYGFAALLYDSRGNLWAGRVDALRGGSLAVFAYTDGAGRRAMAGCRYDPQRRMESYLSRAAGHTVWGRACRPDFDIRQAETLLGAVGLMEDPATGDVTSLSLGGTLLAIRPAGAGTRMTFHVGNPVDLGRKLLPTAEGNWAEQHPGAVDSAHRLWVAATHGRPHVLEAPEDQWLYSIRLDELFTPRPVPLSGVPGRSTVVQAEQTVTTGTVRRPGRWAGTEVDSDAFFAPCLDWPSSGSCGYDDLPGNGFVLRDDSGFGHLKGAVDYRVTTPEAGLFRLGYRVFTFAVTEEAVIECLVGGRTQRTNVSTGGRWQTVWSAEPLSLPAGEETIRLVAPPGGGGWSLNYLILQQV